MKKVGITGGIGSGKSTLSKYLKKNGYPLHDADAFVSKLYEKPNKTFLTILKGFGDNKIIKDKKINKKVVAKNIFVKKEKKNKLEKYIHKKIKEDRNRFIKKQIKLNKKVVFFDIPLLLENLLEKNFDFVLCLISTRAKRSKRIMRNKKFSTKVLNQIFKNQTSDKERRSRSDIIITNNKTKKDFIFKAEKAIINLLK